jgi:hypothetical protein
VPGGQELRIHDLRTGRWQPWIRAADIKSPLWSPRGDRLVVRVADSTRAALLLGSPDATESPDTLMSGGDRQIVYDVMDYVDDNTILLRDPQRPAVYRINLSTRPMRVDTLLTDAYFTVVSPDKRHIAWHASLGNLLYVASYPPGGQRHQIATGAVEPLWLSPTELLFRSNVTWYKARIDGATGELTGPPTIWARDTRFLDTPGWSNRPSWDGGIIYSRSSGQDDIRYLRFLPDFIPRMKSAVDAANR